ncbi:Kdo2-lipid IVA lauroyltransferase [Lebetimonas natsushimae]|uniref:Kdo2-lipid IVA lauroyltransferase n=1 Tax=Lebetimonas natsushimae TaxID=1936991 RepID=A0A292YBB8_9BACT|nr:lipid A biosynthesis lauroyl acyltransferase [Lebetimonas natsushimae]GAX86801.1 Kdo2-lipid IVA lauroyltransferase [Lebetimonas natsushimae]
MNFKDFSYYGYKFIEKIITFFPKEFMINFLGNLGYILDNKRKNVICVNLNLAFPEKSKEEKRKIIKKIYKNFARNLIEFIENKKISKEKLLEKIEFVGFENIPKQAIYVTAHFGNWEITSLSFGAKFGKIDIVYRKLDNPKLNEEVVKSRSRFNVGVIEKKGAMKELVKSIKKGHNIGLLVDQNTAENEGIETVFFNRKVLQSPSAAILSKKFNLPIVMSFAIPKGNKWQVIVKDIFYTDDIQKSVDRQSKVFEEMIKEYPDEYYWFHKKFKHFYEEEYDKKCKV